MITPILALILVAAAIASGIWAHRRRKVIEEVTRRLAELGEGRPVRPILTGVGGAPGRLVRAFDTAAPLIGHRMMQLDGELRQLRAVLSGMAEGVIAVDGRGRLLFANASADALFGLGPSAGGRLLAELIRHPKVHEAIEATLVGPSPHRGEIAIPGRDGAFRLPPRILEVHGTPLLGPPPSGAVLVFHDVTELRRLERMRQDFVANVSHELKTPLASIKAYAETLLDWALHDDQVNVRFLQGIEEQADRLDGLILDLLSLARLESGQEPFDHGPLALAGVVRACVESHSDRSGAKGLTLSLDLGAIDEGTRVLADEEAVRQILDNLIDNAIKYTPAGGDVRVSCSRSPGEIILEVADTGIGIPRDDLPRIFERFYRVDKARSRELGGTGLGLAIVKHLVQSIGGRVGVSSRLNAGSRFTVTLPTDRDPSPAG